jgi:DNA ligase-associated metallophosphoesterase
VRDDVIVAVGGAQGARDATVLAIAGHELVADAAGALYCARERALIVADLHLEKGSSYAQRGVLLPPYDTAATLLRLAALIGRYNPRVVVALGDSFHDRRAGERIAVADRDRLAALQAGRGWIWIAGNHDPEPPAGLGGEAHTQWRLGPLVLRHEPTAGAAPGELAGHLHPVARVWSSAGTTRRRCFVSDGTRCILPAFGAFTGGLNF